MSSKIPRLQIKFELFSLLNQIYLKRKLSGNQMKLDKYLVFLIHKNP